MSIGAILLAGGKGTRLGGAMPKVFRKLDAYPLVFYSLSFFIDNQEIDETVIVAPEEHRLLFPSIIHQTCRFALPGSRRQDSVYSGLQHLSSKIKKVVVHDAARPFLDPIFFAHLIEKGREVQAATLGIPLSFTLRECNAFHQSIATPNRDQFWEILTPQYLDRNLLEEGLTKAYQENITITDDVAAAELLHHPVHVVAGSPLFRKITRNEDWEYAEYYLAKNPFLPIPWAHE